MAQAPDGTRTRGLYLGMVVLYRLSYGSKEQTTSLSQTSAIVKNSPRATQGGKEIRGKWRGARATPTPWIALDELYYQVFAKIAIMADIVNPVIQPQIATHD